MLKKILESSLTEGLYFNYMLVDHSIMKAEVNIKNLKDWIGDVEGESRGEALKSRLLRILKEIEESVADIKKENAKNKK